MNIYGLVLVILIIFCFIGEDEVKYTPEEIKARRAKQQSSSRLAILYDRKRDVLKELEEIDADIAALKGKLNGR